jgi:hypothetical protein
MHGADHFAESVQSRAQLNVHDTIFRSDRYFSFVVTHASFFDSHLNFALFLMLLVNSSDLSIITYIFARFSL